MEYYEDRINNVGFEIKGVSLPIDCECRGCIPSTLVLQRMTQTTAIKVKWLHAVASVSVRAYAYRFISSRRSHRPSPPFKQARITFGYVLAFSILLFISYFDISQQRFDLTDSYRLTLAAVGIVAVGCTVQQSSFYGFTSMLPSR